MFNDSIDTILVPQGAEYRSVCRGLTLLQNLHKPRVIPIGVGGRACTQMLANWQLNEGLSGVLIMGLCGSLSPQYQVGDLVVYQDCIYATDGAEPMESECDRKLTTLLQTKLKERASLVRALTSDRLISSSWEKCQLGEKYNAAVVDMEGFAALEVLKSAGFRVAMVRVISDGNGYDIPDLTPGLNPDGSLSVPKTAIAMLRQPLAAIRLIRGALVGLKVLEQVTTEIFSK